MPQTSTGEDASLMPMLVDIQSKIRQLEGGYIHRVVMPHSSFPPQLVLISSHLYLMTCWTILLQCKPLLTSYQLILVKLVASYGHVTNC